MNDIQYPWWQPVIGLKEKQLILQVLDENYPNEGNLVTDFERYIQKKINIKHAIAVNNCTSAMFLSLKACGIGPGDEVIVPDLTFIATANSVDMCGAKPILVDINSASLNIDTELIEKSITPNTKAIIPVHVTGKPADMDAILNIAKKYNLFVIEDAAEAFMSKTNGKFLGTMGHTGCFSFSPNKIITTGQGGLIITKDNKIYRRICELKDQGRSTRGTGGNDIHNSRGYNFKFTNLQAALGLGQLSYLEERINRLIRTYNMYLDGLNDIDQIQIILFKLYEGNLPLWTASLVENRDALVSYLMNKNIDCRKFWYPLHKQKPYSMSDKSFPVTSKLAPKALWLPSAFTMNDKDIAYIISEIKKFFR